MVAVISFNCGFNFIRVMKDTSKGDRRVVTLFISRGITTMTLHLMGVGPVLCNFIKGRIAYIIPGSWVYRSVFPP